MRTVTSLVFAFLLVILPCIAAIGCGGEEIDDGYGDEIGKTAGEELKSGEIESADGEQTRVKTSACSPLYGSSNAECSAKCIACGHRGGRLLVWYGWGFTNIGPWCECW